MKIREACELEMGVPSLLELHSARSPAATIACLIIALATAVACSGSGGDEKRAEATTAFTPTPSAQAATPEPSATLEAAQTPVPAFVTATPTQTPSFTPTAVIAQTPTPGSELPTELADVPRVSSQDLKALLEAGEVVVVDVRSRSAYERSHIPGAICSPWEEFVQRMPELPQDKVIVTYCT